MRYCYKLFYSFTILLTFFLNLAVANTYDVNSLDDTNTGTGNSGTLRYCITQANSSTGPHIINFSMAGTISINSALPSLTQSITIDGTSAPGYTGTPVIVLDGTNMGGGNGIEITSANCRIYGLQISNFPYNGIEVSGNGADNFKIGAAGKGNIIINNGYRGIEIDGADNGMISYNKVGVDAAGSCGANGYDGIDFSNAADNDSVYSNHVSCNEYNGIQVGGCDGTVIKRNVIGPLATSCAGNLYRGIDLEDGTNNSIVGGSSPSEFNKISGNYYWGIEVKNTSVNNLLSGNSYLCNDYGAIEINNGGNNDMGTPIISSANATTVSGTSAANAIIEIFKSQNTNFNQCSGTPTNQGADYIGTTTADATGNWSMTGTFGGYLVATARDANGNTSEFSSSYGTGVSDTLVNACEGSILNVQSGFIPSAIEICQKNCLDFSDASQNAVAWQWYFPGGSPDQSTVQNPTSICYNSSGSYEVTQVVYDAQGDSSATTITITVNATPPIPLVTLEGDTLNSTSAFSYQWYLDGNIIAGATDQFYVATEDGLYYVQVQDSNGCVSNSIVTEVILNGVQSPQDQLSVTVQSLTNNVFQITIKGTATEKLLLNVFDVAGRMIKEEELMTKGDIYSDKIFLPTPASGFYIIKLQTNHQSFISKVMIQ